MDQEVKDMETKDLAEAQALPSTGGALVGLMPIMGVAEAVHRHKLMVELVRSEIWHDGVDAMVIPGSTRKSLTQPGAQKLAYFFGLSPVFTLLDKIEQWDAPFGKTPLFSYTYSCKLYCAGRYIGEAHGNANSYEAKYMWRWVQEADIPQGLDPKELKSRGGKVSEPKFAIEKGETTGKYGKPAEYWEAFRRAIAANEYTIERRSSRSGNTIEYVVIDSTLYRVPNDDIPSLVNTIIKIAQKRAYVGAVITAANASEFFTQDLEDMAKETLDHVIEGHATAMPHEDSEKAPGGAKGEGEPRGTPPSQEREEKKAAHSVGKAVREGVAQNKKATPPPSTQEAAPWMMNGHHWAQEPLAMESLMRFLGAHQWQVNDLLRVLSARDKVKYTRLEEVELPMGDCMNAMLEWSKAEKARQEGSSGTETGKLL